MFKPIGELTYAETSACTLLNIRIESLSELDSIETLSERVSIGFNNPVFLEALVSQRVTLTLLSVYDFDFRGRKLTWSNFLDVFNITSDQIFITDESLETLPD